MRVPTMRSLIVLLLISAPLAAAPPKVPEKVEVKVGEDYVLTIEVQSDDSFGMAPGFNPKDCTFFEGALRGGKKQFLVRPKKEGNYYVTWWTKGETAYVQTVFTTTGGGGDGDGNDGGGNSPTDPFSKSLLDAFGKEPVETRTQDAKSLVAVYRKLSMGTDGIYNPNIVNEDQLLSLIVNARSAMVSDRMPLVREAIAAQYANAFTGNPLAPVTLQQKNKVADILLRAANILEGVK